MTPEQEAASIGPWVVRAGIAQAGDLILAYHRLDPQLNLYGLSVLYDPQQTSTVIDLIAGAPLTVRQRAKACFATHDELAAAIGPTYVLHLFQSGSYVYHHELILSLAPSQAPTAYLAQMQRQRSVPRSNGV